MNKQTKITKILESKRLIVLAVSPDRTSFIFTNPKKGTSEMELFDTISEYDRPLITPGAVFYEHMYRENCRGSVAHVLEYRFGGHHKREKECNEENNDVSMKGK